MISSDVRLPGMGDASPMPVYPPLLRTRTQAPCCCGFSSGGQATWNAHKRVIFWASTCCFALDRPETARLW